MLLPPGGAGSPVPPPGCTGGGLGPGRAGPGTLGPQPPALTCTARGGGGANPTLGGAYMQMKRGSFPAEKRQLPPSAG